jgi:hypothetical protein
MKAGKVQELSDDLKKLSKLVKRLQTDGVQKEHDLLRANRQIDNLN